MLACALWCAIASAEGAEKNDAQPLRDKNGEPVQAGVFTSRWGRLFSGNDKVFSGALSFSSGLKRAVDDRPQQLRQRRTEEKI